MATRCADYRVRRLPGAPITGCADYRVRRLPSRSGAAGRACLSAGMPRFSFVPPIAVASLVLGGCLQATPTCSETAAAEFNAISHYPGTELAPEPHVYGACFDSFAVDDEPDMVLDWYETELEAGGYTVERRETFPITDEAGRVVGRTVDLSASNGTFIVSITGELFEDQPSSTTRRLRAAPIDRAEHSGAEFQPGIARADGWSAPTGSRPYRPGSQKVPCAVNEPP